MAVLGSHNSFSYSTPKKWWMRLFNFAAKCQEVNIKTQYEQYNVRCFDLRIKFDKSNNPIIAHNKTVYDIKPYELFSILEWLNNKKDVSVRILHEVRTKSEYNVNSIYLFNKFCKKLLKTYQNINFWCGRNLYNWNVDFEFLYQPSCKESYGSVTNPKWLNGLCPKRWAKKHNKEICLETCEEDILLMDFVNIK